MSKYTNFQHIKTKEAQKIKKISKPNETIFGISDLVSYLPFSIENMCMNYLKITVLCEPDYKLGVPNVVKTVDNDIEMYESVSDITGVAIPAYFEYQRMGKSSLFSKNLVEKNITKIENGNYETSIKLAMITKLKKFSKTLKEFHKKHIENIDTVTLTVNDLLKISLYYSSQQNKTDYKLKQVTVFDWLTEEALNIGTDRLSKVVKGSNLLFEESIEADFYGSTIMGEVDCIDMDSKVVYEFKCTNDLTMSHMIQLGIYMWIHSFGNPGYKYILFNVFTGEMREITGTKFDEMITILVEHKMMGETIKSDSEFLEQFSGLSID